MTMKNIIRIIKNFINRLSADGVGALSAQAAFFLILSFFPFAMLVIPLIKYIPLSPGFIEGFSQTVLPYKIEILLNDFAAEISEKPSISFISMTALTVLWTASGGILSLMRGFNVINQVQETRNYISLRLTAAFYTAIFVLIIAVMMTVFLFGNVVYKYIVRFFPVVISTAQSLIIGRTFIGIIALSFLFWMFYCFLPNRRCSLLSSIPGSVLSAAAWIVFSYAYSFYIDHISNYPYIYGSLSAIVFLMLWLYICMYILFIGEEINIFLRENHIKILK